MERGKKIGKTVSSSQCSGSISVPHTDMKTGEFYWSNEPCTQKAEPGSDLCFMCKEKRKHPDKMPWNWKNSLHINSKKKARRKEDRRF